MVGAKSYCLGKKSRPPPILETAVPCAHLLTAEGPTSETFTITKMKIVALVKNSALYGYFLSGSDSRRVLRGIIAEKMQAGGTAHWESLGAPVLVPK